MSNTVCVLIRSMPSSHFLPRIPSRRRCQGSLAAVRAFSLVCLRDAMNDIEFPQLRASLRFPICLADNPTKWLYGIAAWQAHTDGRVTLVTYEPRAWGDYEPCHSVQDPSH